MRMTPLWCSGCQRHGVITERTSWRVQWRCPGCGAQHSTPLPKTRKRVIYLDAWVLSFMFDALNGNERGAWRQLFDLLLDGVKAQTLVCPRSTHHDLELGMTQRGEPALRATAALTGGIRFADHDTIAVRQMRVALSRFLSATTNEPIPEPPSRGYTRDIEEWAWPSGDGLRHERPTTEEIDDYEQRKARATTRMTDLSSRRRAEGLSFEAMLEAERHATGFVAATEYVEYLAGLGAAMLGDPDAIARMFDDVRTLPSLLRQLHRYIEEVTNTSWWESFRILGAFLRSEEFRSVPHQEIQSHLHAALGVRLARDQNYKRSDLLDINIVSYYAPYSDVMILDRAFADVTREKRVRLWPSLVVWKSTPLGRSIG